MYKVKLNLKIVKMTLMTETASKLDNLEELGFSYERGFFEKSPVIRFLIGILFALSLFAILHFREVRIEVLELNSLAPSYIVAQTSFDFYDEEATIILKQEAVRDISKIYRISDQQIRKRRLEFENFLIKDEKWRSDLPNSTFDEMYKGGDALEKAMAGLRLTDPRTLQKMTELQLPTSHYTIYTPISNEEPIHLSQKLWAHIKKEAFPANAVDPEAAAFILRFFEDQKWSLEEDIPAQRGLRKKIQSLVPDKYTFIRSGSRIIDQGEKITSRHIAILQAMKKALNEQRNLWSFKTLTGSFALAVLLTGICAAYIYVNNPEVMSSNRKLFLIVTVAVLTFGIAKATEFFFLYSQSNLIEVIRYPLFVPFSSILLCSLLNSSIATFSTAFITVVLMMTLAFDQQEFMIMNLSAGVVGILNSRRLRQRKEIFVVCAKVWLCCIGIIISLHLYLNTDWNGIFIDILSAGGFLLLTGVLVLGLLPLLESSFKILTEVTLMEYMDPNQDLLRRLSIEAPGTYQHSVVVGNLAEAAALAIGANGLFCRVATLYHDIGKMTTPQYFTENQHGGMNIHQLLTPQESAQVIIAHVPEGVALARKAGLPEPFIDIIKEHHGTTLVYYFYRKEVEKHQGEAAQVDPADFRYSGPKPRTKESAIIMIADSMEAASRSLDQMNEQTVMDLTSRIIREKYNDGQFDETTLTLQELCTVKETLVKTLVAYGHSRVKYPKRDVGEETLRDDI